MIKVQIERKKLDDLNLVEYRLTIVSMERIDQEIDKDVPEKYIAGYVINALRECLNKCELDDEVKTVIGNCKKNDVFTCPECGGITWAI